MRTRPFATQKAEIVTGFDVSVTSVEIEESSDKLEGDLASVDEAEAGVVKQSVWGSSN